MQTIRIGKLVRKQVGAVILLVLAAVLIHPTNLAFGQNSSSGVNGVVTDPSGAAVPGAKIILKNADTNVERVTTSKGPGDYFFTSVPPARYMLIVSAPAFQTEKISTFEVGVAQVVTVNVALKIGNVNQSITVSATNTEVESSSAQLGAVISGKAVNDLPLNGRNFTQLLDLTPGVTPISTAQNYKGNVTPMIGGNGVTNFSFPSINGAQNRSTMYLMDGMDDDSNWYDAYAVPPIIDTIAEFKVNSHNDSSQYGGVTGGVVNIATKAGGNSYHGSAWEYVRSNSFDADPFFTALPSYHLNTFGSQAGGPVRIPKLYNGKNKTFFEIGFEISHFEDASSTNYLEPTLAELDESTWGGPTIANGYLDFSSAQTGAKGSCVAGSYSTGACQLYDPTVGNFAATPYRPAYLGNQIPISEVSPQSIAFINAIFTTPPTTIAGFPTTTYNGQITTPERQETYNYTGRIDQHIGDKDFIFFRYSGFQYYDLQGGKVPNQLNYRELPAQQYGVSWTHIFNPSTSIQVQYDKTHVAEDVTETFDISQPAWQIFGCSANMCQDYVAGASIMSEVSVTGGFDAPEEILPSTNLSSIHEWSGSVSKTIGRHLFQAGGGWDETNYTAIIEDATLTYSGAATGNFSGNPDSVHGSSTSAQSGFGLADFLLDFPSGVLRRNVELSERPGGVGNIFLQDSWKLNTRLMVNLGVRYDRSVIPPFGTAATAGLNGGINAGDFDFTDGTYIVQQLPALCSVQNHSPCLPSATLPARVVVATGGKILHGTKTNVSPRVGFAYRVNEGLSIRGGFEIVYDNWAAITQIAQNYQGSWPDTGTLQITNTNTPAANGVYISGQNPFAANGGNLPAATPFTSANAGSDFVSPYLKNPYSEQYNLGIEQQLGHSSILALNYVGSATHRMDYGGDYNTGSVCGSGCPYASYAARITANATGQPYPWDPYPVASWDHNAASASYNALQAAVRGHYSFGVSYMASYTWSKTLDEADGYFGTEDGAPEDPYNPKGDRGPAGYNIPQMFVLSGEYAIPIGRGKSFSTGNKAADYALGNWQFNGILTARSGEDFNLESKGDIAETGNGGTYERPNRVGNPYQPGPIAANPGCTPPAGNTRTRYQWFNPCAFETPAAGTLGTNGRNSLQAQNLWNLDASIFRYFPVWDTLQVKIAAEAYNTLNHPVLGTPGLVSTTTSSFGEVTSVQTGNANRIMQFSVKLEF